MCVTATAKRRRKQAKNDKRARRAMKRLAIQRASELVSKRRK